MTEDEKVKKLRIVLKSAISKARSEERRQMFRSVNNANEELKEHYQYEAVRAANKAFHIKYALDWVDRLWLRDNWCGGE